MNANGRLAFWAVVCVLVAGWSAGTSAKIIYVDIDAREEGTGASWADACRYLQTALIAAAAGDEIRVAQGLYRPDQGVPERPPVRGRRAGAIEMAAIGSPLDVFSLKNGVALLGGFAGFGTVDPNARDPQRYETVLTGDLRGNDVDFWEPGSPMYEYLLSDNSLVVVQCLVVDATTLLDGFVVTSGVNSNFLNQGGSPRVANCVFRKGVHGALRCEGGQPTLTNCTFQENSSPQFLGGAVYVTGAHLNLTKCRFLDNWAAQEGGALCSTSSDLTLTGCTFERNIGSAGGALHQTAGTLMLVDCTFEGNTAQEGGAVAFAAERVSMTRCLFRKNVALGSGGALQNGGASLTLDQCTFLGNRGGRGGALHTSRMTVAKTASGFATTMTHCICAGNYAFDAGGAVYCDQVELTVRSSTFTGNRAGRVATIAWTDVGAAAAAYPTTLENCIVWDGGSSLGPVLSTRAPRSASQVTTAPNVVVRYSDVQGGWLGEGNSNIDPAFAASGWWVDPDYPGVPTEDYPDAIWIEGDCHLKSQAGRWDPVRADWVLDLVTSPCIDAGDPASPVADEPEPNGGRINMGACGGTPEASKSYPEPQTPGPSIIRR